jgi:protein-S-isoprenylcysteine O-methyltransferase Ste14
MKKKLSSYVIGVIGILSLIIYSLFDLTRLFSTDLSSGVWFYNFVDKYLGSFGLWLFFVVASLNLILLTRSEIGKLNWKSKSIYIAFMISLFTEMFGAALIVYLFSPFIKYPLLTPIYNVYIFPPIVKILSFNLIFLGIVLIIIGWREIYNSEGIVTKGLYKFIRHPQYLGFILLATGWIFAWPTVIVLILYPFLVGIFLYQAVSEDKLLENKYKSKFVNYKKRTGFILPKLRS